MIAIFSNSLSSYFSSFVKVISLGLLITTINLFIWLLPSSSILNYGFADLTMLFETLPYVLIFLIPSITMNTIVSDFELGTSDLLFSKPFSISSFWWTNFLFGSFLIFIFLSLTSTSYYSIIQLKSELGIIDHGQILASFLGTFLVSIVFLVLSMFCSSFSKTQATAFLISIILCYGWYSLPGYISELNYFSGGLDYFLKYLSIDTHFYTLSRGILEVRSLLYFSSIIILFSLLGIRNIYNRLA